MAANRHETKKRQKQRTTFTAAIEPMVAPTVAPTPECQIIKPRVELVGISKQFARLGAAPFLALTDINARIGD